MKIEYEDETLVDIGEKFDQFGEVMFVVYEDYLKRHEVKEIRDHCNKLLGETQ